jgi:hypothetical protein
VASHPAKQLKDDVSSDLAGGVYVHYGHTADTDGNSARTETRRITIETTSGYDPDVNGDGVVGVLGMIRVGHRLNKVGSAGWIPEDVDENVTADALDMIVVWQQWARLLGEKSEICEFAPLV